MNKNPKVDAYLAALDHPHLALWHAIRETILSVDSGIEEAIKWGAPTFIYKGNIATFNPRAKNFVNLTFHTGATIDDPESVLEGDAKEARSFRVSDAADFAAKKDGLEAVIRNWIDLQDR